MNKQETDCLCLGEVLVDLVQIEDGDRPRFEANAGGAPANVASALAKWGNSSAFVGRVGNDSWGRIIQRTLASTGLLLDGLASIDRPTTMAVVSLGPDGERTFEFHRDRSADTQLKSEELNPEWIERTKILHFGTLSLTVDPLRTTTMFAVSLARASKKIISFDPNLRPALWKSRESMREAMIWGLEQADIVKASEDELWFLLDRAPVIGEPRWHAMREVLDSYDLQVLLVTAGDSGCYCVSRAWQGARTPPRVLPIDTTGAGDSFMAGFLHYMIDDGRNVDEWTADDYERALDWANAAGALTTQKRGAISAIPSLAEMDTVLGC